MDCPPLNMEVNIKMFENLCKPLAEGMLTLIKGLIGIFSNIYQNILEIDISDAGIVMTGVNSAGVALTSLFLCMEFFTQMTSKWFERIEDAIQLGIKLVVAKIIIENSSSIIGGIYSYFKNLGSISMSEGLNAVSQNLNAVSGLDSMEGGFMGIAYLGMAIVLALILVIVFIILVLLAVEIIGIVFEIGIHQAVGPIALSTLCNSTFRSTGLSFIKSYSAVCLQTTVIGAIFKVYAAFYDKLDLKLDLGDFTADGFISWLFGFFTPILGLIVICVTVKKSSDITKRMFGA